MVTYPRSVNDDDRVFKALADPTRRFLLDRLFERDGRTLTELESELEMTRFGVDEAPAGPRRRRPRGHAPVRTGEAPLPQPRADPADPRPVDRQVPERQVSALADLKHELEGEHGMTAATRRRATTQVYRVYIKATPQAIWDAITKPRVDPALRLRRLRASTTCGPAARYRVLADEGMRAGAKQMGFPDPDVVVDGEVIEADPPQPPGADLADADGPGDRRRRASRDSRTRSTRSRAGSASSP